MANEFKQYYKTDIGVAEVICVTAPVKSLLVNLTVANKVPQPNAVSLAVLKLNNDKIYLTQNTRLNGNLPTEIIKSNKIVLEVGDKLVMSASIDNSCDIMVSMLEGVK